jgi:hypothetical protein
VATWHTTGKVFICWRGEGCCPAALGSAQVKKMTTGTRFYKNNKTFWSVFAFGSRIKREQFLQWRPGQPCRPYFENTCQNLVEGATATFSAVRKKSRDELAILLYTQAIILGHHFFEMVESEGCATNICMSQTCGRQCSFSRYESALAVYKRYQLHKMNAHQDQYLSL